MNTNVLTAEKSTEPAPAPFRIEPITYPVAVRKIEEMAAEYMPLTVSGIKDVEGLKVVRAARLTVKAKRCEVEKRRKELGKSALEYQRQVNSVANEIFALLEPIETHLTAEENKVAEEHARVEREAAEAQRAKTHARVEDLQAVGVVLPWTHVEAMPEADFVGRVEAGRESKRRADAVQLRLSAFRAVEYFPPAETIAAMSDQEFALEFEAATARLAEARARRDKEEADRKAAAERLAQERAELERQRELEREATEKARREQEERLAAERAELAKQREADEHARREQEAKLAAERQEIARQKAELEAAEKAARATARMAEIAGMGIPIDVAATESLTDAAWERYKAGVIRAAEENKAREAEAEAMRALPETLLPEPAETSGHRVGRQFAQEDYPALSKRLVGACAAEGYVLELARLLGVSL